jgi:hypothetical protein
MRLPRLKRYRTPAEASKAAAAKVAKAVTRAADVLHNSSNLQPAATNMVAAMAAGTKAADTSLVVMAEALLRLADQSSSR